jgi:hypothetical protein
LLKKGADKMNTLKKYIIATTNLYGVVHKNKALEIYNSQNKEKAMDEDISDIIINQTEVLQKNFVYICDAYFVHEAIMEFDEVDHYLKEKADKPYYIPKKESLLKYAEDGYFEKTKEYKTLLNYVKKHFVKGEDAEDLCLDIYDGCALGHDIQSIIEEFNSRNIGFSGIEQVNEVVQMINELYNNARIWENNGHTPREIFEMMKK